MVRHDTERRGFCKRMPAIALALLLISFSASAAQPVVATENVYTVADVRVNETAEDAGKARKIALDKAQAQAFVALLDRLVSPRSRDKAPALGEAEIATLVQAIEVGEEKIGGTTYQAQVTVRFHPDKVRSLLKEKQVEFAEKIAPLALVVPMLQENNQVYLWEPQNLWRDAWNKHAYMSWAVPVAIPAGDLEDVRVLSSRNVMLGDFKALEQLASRYHAGEVILAEAMIEERAVDKPPVLNVLLRFLKGTQIRSEKTLYVEGEEGQDRAALFEKAINGVVQTLEEQWKKQVESGEPSQNASTLEVKVPFSGLSEWVEIKKRIEEVKTIKAMEVLSLAANHARIVIRYDSDPVEEFAVQLLATGLALRQGSFGEWELHLLRSAGQ